LHFWLDVCISEMKLRHRRAARSPRACAGAALVALLLASQPRAAAPAVTLTLDGAPAALGNYSKTP